MKEQLIHQILTRYWGHSSFRPLQKEIILSVLDGKDTLALLPTGGGKSICFQVPAMAMEGICLVISPLIALMKDQVENLKRIGIPAAAIISGMTRREIDITLDNCIYGKIKFLYVSPERLSTEIFLERVGQMKVCLLAVDESHCISQWGYDFRPAYLRIAEIREKLPGIPVLALTATATRQVELDIQKRLGFSQNLVFRKSFVRENLSYLVLYEEDKLNRVLKILQHIKGTGIIYARTRKRCQDLATFLSNNKVAAGFYHAGLSSEMRTSIQDRWMKEKIRVMVATNAFGMGIDKPNVRFVIHFDSPDSIEAYYQEAGRAGRDEKKSFGILLYNQTDRESLEQRIESTFPDLKNILATYQALGNFLSLPVGSGKGRSFDFDLASFCNTYDLNVMETFNSMKILELQGLIAMNDGVGLQSRILFQYHADELYEFQIKNPGFDHFIKVILRSYEGVFDEFVAINESELALRSAISKEDCILKLNTLDRLKILTYLPANDQPQVTWTEERLEVRNLHIDRENLADRKARFLERARAFLNYAESKHRCRSQMLVMYFGQDNVRRYGSCDYCLKRNKADISDFEFDKIQEDVRTTLLKQTTGLQELLQHINSSDEAKTLRAIEWMIDQEQIAYADGDKLRWTAD